MTKRSRQSHRVSKTDGEASLSRKLDPRRAFQPASKFPKGSTKELSVSPTTGGRHARQLGEILHEESRTEYSPVMLRLKAIPTRRIRIEYERRHDEVPPKLGKAIQACCSGDAPFPLFIYGPAGTGKTCAALDLCDHVAGRVLFRDFSEITEEVRESKLGHLEATGTHDSCRIYPAEYWRQWCKYDLAVIDEIGERAAVSDHQWEVLKNAIDKRHRRPTVLISNLSLSELGKIFDDRIASRIGGGTVIRLEGDDRRVARDRT